MINEFDENETPRRVGRGEGQEHEGKFESHEPSEGTASSAEHQDEILSGITKDPFDDPVALAEMIRSFKDQGLGRVIDLRVAFGFDVVFIPVPHGEKGPKLKGWTDYTSKSMHEASHLHDLNRGNIAILTGPNSGNLISVDLDTDEAAESFLKVNPNLSQQTIRTRGSRGCNFWFRIKGEYPSGPQPFLDASGNPIGELRAGRCVTVVHGTHPDGMDYTRDGNRVASCSFEVIEWPESWSLPWVSKPEDDLFKKEGGFFVVGKQGKITLNEPAIVEKYSQEHLVLHDPGLGFYEYETSTGVWESKTKAFVSAQFSRDIKSLADQSEVPALQYKRSRTLLNSLTEQLTGCVELKDAFRDRPEGVIHVRNGMLRVTADTVDIEDFSPAFLSLGQIPIDYNPEAECPRFLNDLLRHALPENDILLLQKYAGQVLLGSNISQTLLILEGEGGTGKGQIGVVIDRIVGSRNVTELRTAQLSGRFEMKAFVGKKLLAGRYVAGDFLNQKGATAIKKLTGGDLMSVESKGKDERSEITGDFNLIVTANTRLVVAIEGDKSAWRRRLLIIPFEREPVGKPVPNIGKKLVKEEGEGILSWMVEGAKLLLKDLSEHGRIELDAIQRKRVSDLLAESDSVFAFVTRRVVRTKEGKVFTSELFEDYIDFCRNNDMPEISKTAFQRRVRTEMLQAHQAAHSENIERRGRRGRGYLGVQLLSNNEEDAAIS